MYPMPLWAHEYPLSHLGRSIVEPEVWAKIDYHSAPGSCWVWTGAFNKRDQQPVFDGGRSVRRHMFDALVGTRSSKDVIRMTCETMMCVRPDHMRVGNRGAHLRNC